MPKLHNFDNTVYGVILNDKKTLAKLATSFNEIPYKNPPKAPVLYIKPFSTINTDNVVNLPKEVQTLEVGATLGLIIGKTAKSLTLENALSHIESVALVADMSIPHDSYYRPAIREKCYDGSLVIGEKISIDKLSDIGNLMITTQINGQIANTRTLGELHRGIEELLVDVTEFMMLNVGDILMVGVEYQAPKVKKGDKVTISAKGLTDLDFVIDSTDTATSKKAQSMPMPTEKIGRILHNGKIQNVTAKNDKQIQTQAGEILDETAVDWLPPIEIGSVFALGLNYADHAKELAFKAPETPLVFLKGKNTLVGHNAQTPRPQNVEYMHYECELAVVIGKQAYQVSAEDAKDYILGYTIANDYAIRDYLENYYRPNLRVKNRDKCTPIGPWLTPANQITDPMSLQLTTRVNGEVTQQGNTSDMIFDVYKLVEYLSSIMTLNPGDVILTGTPEGLVDVKVGDIIETEIEGLGVLRNTIVEKNNIH